MINFTTNINKTSKFLLLHIILSKALKIYKHQKTEVGTSNNTMPRLLDVPHSGFSLFSTHIVTLKISFHSL
jgi:hypothetical protein